MSAIKANQVLNLDGDRIGSVVVDTIANMKNLNPEIEANATVELLGYYSKSDGGGGTFYWDSTSIEDDNGGTIIEATGVVDGRWIRKYSGAVNVKWFGAKGDGVTDDTAAIQKALDSTSEAVWFSDGEYRITDTVYVTTSIHSDGSYKSGYRALIVMDSAAPKAILAGDTNDSDALRNIEGVSISGKDDQSKIHTAIYGKGYRLKLTDIRIRNCAVGVDIAGVYIWNTRLDISTCIIGYYPSTLHRDAPDVGSTMFSFEECIFNYNSTGFYQKHRYGGGGGNSEDLLNVTFKGCGFEHNTTGLWAENRIWNLTVQNSWFEANSEYGLKIEATSTDVTEINNRHESNSPYMLNNNYSKLAHGSIDSSSFGDYLQVKGPINSDIPSTISSNYTDALQGMDIGAIIRSGNENTLLAIGYGGYNVLGKSGLAFLNGYGDSGGTGHTIVSDRSIEGGGTAGRGALRFFTNSKTSTSEVLRLGYKGLYPAIDANSSLGRATNRWSVIFSSTGTINTSDDREKTYRDITEGETLVAKELKGLMKSFRFNDAIASKGDEARIHFGTSAQTVKATFEKYGLVAEDYALLCYDEWEAEYEQVVDTEAILDEEGNVITEATYKDGELIKEAGNRYGIRYTELLCFIIGAI